MTSPLKGSLAKTIGKAMSSLFLDATLTRPGTSTGAVYDPTAGTATDFPCRAIFDEWGAYFRSSGLVTAADRKVLILASTLAVEPQEGDVITIDAVSLVVVSGGEGQPAVTTDPAKATWTLRARA